MNEHVAITVDMCTMCCFLSTVVKLFHLVFFLVAVLKPALCFSCLYDEIKLYALMPAYQNCR